MSNAIKLHAIQWHYVHHVQYVFDGIKSYRWLYCVHPYIYLVISHCLAVIAHMLPVLSTCVYDLLAPILTSGGRVTAVRQEKKCRMARRGGRRVRGQNNSTGWPKQSELEVEKQSNSAREKWRITGQSRVNQCNGFTFGLDGRTGKKRTEHNKHTRLNEREKITQRRKQC